MLEGLASVRALKFAVAVGAALFLAACANDKATTGAGDLASLGSGSATPGSSQDFQENVGDRVLFGKYSGSEIKLNGVEHVILHEDDILGVLDAGANVSF